METVRQTVLEINKSNLIHNIEQIREKVGKNVDIMPVIKARAYGTGTGTLIDLFDELKINLLGVAVVDEGIALRQRGYKGNIVILYPSFVEEIESIKKYNLTPSVCTKEFITGMEEFAKKENYVQNVHLEIDTGMNRTGINIKEVEEYINLLSKCKNLNLEGIYTHFSSSDTDADYTEKQILKFDEALNKIKEKFNPTYIHACNSAGIINFPQAHYNLVRPGLMIHGYLPDDSLKNEINLKPTTILKTRVTFIKEVDEGTKISYNQKYVAPKKMKIATIPIGYADGVRGTLSNIGEVLINGKRAKILGTICMDGFMVDVTDINNVEIGTEVYIWDNENITVEEIAEKCGTINYEILSGISPRVRKEFI